MLRPQLFRRGQSALPPVRVRLAEIRSAAESGAQSEDELRRAVYTLVGLPPAFGQAPVASSVPAGRLHRRSARHVRQARAS